MNKNQGDEIIRKTVSFGPSEKKLYEDFEELCNNEKIKFATYVKKLIKEHLEGSPKNQDIESILDKYFKNKNITLENKNDTVDNKNSYTQEDKVAVFNFIKRNK